jgi:uncharacterized protein YciI
MKRLLLLVSAAAVLFRAGGAAQTAQPTPPPSATPVVGPGGFEMTTYYVGFLYTGPNTTPEASAESEALQKAHLANILRLFEEGKLLVAGPFTDGGDLRGLYVFRVGSMAEARALAETDPVVKAGRLRLEFHPWFAAKNITVTARPAPAR